MRFRRQEHYEFTDTARKRAAVVRKQARECEALPLFAEQIAATQPAVENVMRDRAEAFARWEGNQRTQRASDWRRARRVLGEYQGAERAALVAYWNACRWPADPVYLLCMLNMYATGRLDLQQLG